MRPEDATRLAKTFPVLQEAEGIDPWDPAGFRRWLFEGQTLYGEVATTYAGLYVLHRWSGGRDEPHSTLGEFNLVRALEAWDHEQRGAFLADIIYATNPPGFRHALNYAEDLLRSRAP